MASMISCPECGCQVAPDLLRCTECQAFIHDSSPWRSDHNLLVIPISLIAWFVLFLILRIEGMPTRIILDDKISQTILFFCIYGLLVLIMKLRVTSRQVRAFRIVREACVGRVQDWQEVLAEVRETFDRQRLGAFNTLLAYNRLQWLANAVQLPLETRTGMVESLRHHSETDWESLDSSFATTRYLVWLLPSAGFLGTVWGMTGALRGFARAVESGVGDISFSSALTETSQQLGVAFYTTLVGLATVIPVFFLAITARRRAQSFLERLDKFFIRLSTEILTRPEQAPAAPPPVPTADPVPDRPEPEPATAVTAEPTVPADAATPPQE